MTPLGATPLQLQPASYYQLHANEKEFEKLGGRPTENEQTKIQKIPFQSIFHNSCLFLLPFLIFKRLSSLNHLSCKVVVGPKLKDTHQKDAGNIVI